MTLLSFAFTLSFFARLTLAAVFAVAGFGKVRDPDGTDAMLRAFGFPSGMAPFGARILPIIELLIAIGLFTPGVIAFAGFSGLLLLGAFTAAVALNLAKGRHPECHCFGAGPSVPISTGTLVRNLALTAVAACAAFLPRGIPEWVSVAPLPLVVAGGVIAAVAGLQLVLLWQIVSQQGRILMRLDAIENGRERPQIRAEFEQGIPVGAPAPRFSLPDLRGSIGSLTDLLSLDRPVVLFFMSASCGPCHTLVPQINAWQSEHSGELSFAVIAEGSAHDNERIFSDYPSLRVFLQQAREVSESYGAHGTPGAVLIGTDGAIGSALAMGAQPIAALIARAVPLGRLRSDSLPVATL